MQLHYHGSVYLANILLMQPWLTRSRREISLGRTPRAESSTMRCLTANGSGRPLMKTPPSWFTPLSPADNHQDVPEKKSPHPNFCPQRNKKTKIANRLSLDFVLLRTVRKGEWHLSQKQVHSDAVLKGHFGCRRVKCRLCVSLLPFDVRPLDPPTSQLCR